MSALFDIDLADASTFPSRRTEAWKYSDLRRYLREAPQPSPTAAIGAPGPFYDLGGEAIVFANGRAVGVTDFIASGEQTLRLRYISDAQGTGHTASARVAARAGARLLLLETHEGAGSAYVAHNTLELDVAAGAEVTRVVLVEEPEDALSIAQAQVRVEAGGVFRQTVIATGARLQRVETRIDHHARGAHVQADGLYLLNGARQADLTSVVRHLDRDGTTSQLIKGVARDTARGVFQGKIVVRPGAQKTDGYQLNRALLLSDQAEIDSKPELEIYADDVKCAHGATVGQLDEQARYYMAARGLPPETARKLLVRAFLGDAFVALEDEEESERLMDVALGKLDKHL